MRETWISDIFFWTLGGFCIWGLYLYIKFLINAKRDSGTSSSRRGYKYKDELIERGKNQAKNIINHAHYMLKPENIERSEILRKKGLLTDREKSYREELLRNTRGSIIRRSGDSLMSKDIDYWIEKNIIPVKKIRRIN